MRAFSIGSALSVGKLHIRRVIRVAANVTGQNAGGVVEIVELAEASAVHGVYAVSYTHLTLPTILRV